MGTGVDQIGPPVDASQPGITAWLEDSSPSPVYRRLIVLVALMTVIVLEKVGVLPVEIEDWLGPLLSVLL